MPEGRHSVTAPLSESSAPEECGKFGRGGHGVPPLHSGRFVAGVPVSYYRGNEVRVLWEIIF